MRGAKSRVRMRCDFLISELILQLVNKSVSLLFKLGPVKRKITANESLRANTDLPKPNTIEKVLMHC